MSTVTDELQVTIPKGIAERYGIMPGREVEFVAEGDAPRLVVVGGPPPEDAAAVERGRRAERWIEETRALIRDSTPDRDPAEFGRDWTRADLYEPPRGWPRDWPL